MKRRQCPSFALVKWVVVLAGIVIFTVILLMLAGSTSRKVRMRSLSYRTQAEIAAICTALESYKHDHGHYPPGTAMGCNPKDYIDSAISLYTNLSGKNSINATTVSGTVYMDFKPSQVGRAGAFSYVCDPYGCAYGYRTNGPMNPGFFDLWSTSGKADSSASSTNRWITNWAAP